MVFLTGDIHGDVRGIIRFATDMELTEKDTIIILGDVGLNYYGNSSDHRRKKLLSRIDCRVLCIHGNHEMRPATVPGYITKVWNGGVVWYEEEFPNLLFAKDGEIFNLDDYRLLVIGGAYSVDKFYRLTRGGGWWEDEQPSAEIKAYVEEQLSRKTFDIIISHTCPKKYIPTEMFLSCIDQAEVDQSTEEWLDSIEDRSNYVAWYCGHWHTDKRIDRMHFLFHSFECLSDLKPNFIIEESEAGENEATTS